MVWCALPRLTVGIGWNRLSTKCRGLSPNAHSIAYWLPRQKSRDRTEDFPEQIEHRRKLYEHDIFHLYSDLPGWHQPLDICEDER